jgi:hypothetical protein
MDLKEFISESLVQIQEGVQDAIHRRQAKKDSSGVINPVWGNADDISAEHCQDVEFDVAVTVSDKMSGSAKGGLKIYVAEFGGEGSKSSERSTVNRLKFSVPVVPPVQLVSKQ